MKTNYDSLLHFTISFSQIIISYCIFILGAPLHMIRFTTNKISLTNVGTFFFGCVMNLSDNNTMHRKKHCKRMKRKENIKEQLLLKPQKPITILFIRSIYSEL